MQKTKTIEYTICDYNHDEEVEAFGKTYPSGNDACEHHLKAYTEEIRLPDEFNSEMSGLKIAVDPTYEAKMVITYNKEK